jgi:serine protease
VKTSVWAFGVSVIAVAVTAALPAGNAMSSEPGAARVKRAMTEDPMVGQLMVKLRNAQPSETVTALSANRMAALSSSAGVSMKAVRAMSLGASVVALPSAMKLSEANAVAARLMADPNVEWAAPDVQVRRMQVTPPNPGYALRQWNLGVPASMFNSAGLGQSGTTKMFPNGGGANLPPAWAATQGAGTVRVAIIDTGVTLTHPAIQAAMLPGYDFTSSTSGTTFGLPAGFLKNKPGVDARDADATDPGDWVSAADKTAYAACRSPGETAPYQQDDSSWHGTHMAGIVASQWGPGTAAGTSIAGIAPNVKIIPVRALGKCGGSSSDIIDAITWASGGTVPNVPNIANAANVINLSLGSSAGSCTGQVGTAYQAAFTAAALRGVTVVAATGNDGANSVSLPANCAGVIAVTAHVINGDNADYANVGTQVALSAPGGGRESLLAPNPAVATTDTAFYVWSSLLFGATSPSSPGSGTNAPSGPAIAGFTGTSPATPHVGGVAALLLSLSPGLSPAAVRDLLTNTASVRPHPAGGYCAQPANAGTCGSGLLDAGKAIALHNLRRPTVTAADQAATANTQVTLSSSVAAGTSGGTTYTYQWTQTAGRSVTLSSATLAQPTFTAPVANGPLTFTVTATDNNGYRSAAQTKTVTVSGGADAPAITAQPQPATVNVGQTATFSVTATGTAPLTYQWSRNGTAVNGATAASYTTPATGAGDSGVTYTVTITNAAGSVTSSGATLTVNAAPPPPSGGGGGGGSLPLLPLALLMALSLARRVRRV